MINNNKTNEIIAPILPENVRLLKLASRDIGENILNAALFTQVKSELVTTFWLTSAFCATTKAKEIEIGSFYYNGNEDHRHERKDMDTWQVFAPSMRGIIYSTNKSSISLEEAEKNFGAITMAGTSVMSIRVPVICNEYRDGSTCSGTDESIFSTSILDQIISGEPNDDLSNGNLEISGFADGGVINASFVYTTSSQRFEQFKLEQCKTIERCLLSLGW